MIDSPCKDCPEKGCGPKHDTCQLYQQWKKENPPEKTSYVNPTIGHSRRMHNKTLYQTRQGKRK